DHSSMYRPNCSTLTWTSVAARGCSWVHGPVPAPRTRARTRAARKIELLLSLGMGDMTSFAVLPGHYTSGNRIFGISNWRLQYGGDFQSSIHERSSISNPGRGSARHGSTVCARDRAVDEHSRRRNF